MCKAANNRSGPPTPPKAGASLNRDRGPLVIGYSRFGSLGVGQKKGWKVGRDIGGTAGTSRRGGAGTGGEDWGLSGYLWVW